MVFNLDERYHTLLRMIDNYGSIVGPRGQLTKEYLDLRFYTPHDMWFINYKELPLSLKYIAAETLWYESSDRSNLNICEFAEIWTRCIDHEGLIQSNYGYYLFHENQRGFSRAFLELKEDKESRRAVIPINRMEHNYVGAPDVPCTMYIGFYIRDNMLHMNVRMRSQDAIYGLRNDLVFFQYVFDKMYRALYTQTYPQLKRGRICWQVDSFHVYEKHFHILEKASSNNLTWEELNVPKYEEFYAWCVETNDGTG